MKTLEGTLVELFEELGAFFDDPESAAIAALLERFDDVRAKAGPLMVTMTIAALAGPDTDEESTEAQFAALLLLRRIWREYGTEKYDETFRGYAVRVLDSFIVDMLDDEIGRYFCDEDGEPLS